MQIIHERRQITSCKITTAANLQYRPPCRPMRAPRRSHRLGPQALLPAPEGMVTKGQTLRNLATLLCIIIYIIPYGLDMIDCPYIKDRKIL